ncbi:hypothetical protein Pst134EB_029986 [Puccinia striiformis f. sp. tritici]|uniref:Uncharacterized protein n=1 Tax=Puccinia striiformis f. sp. tritici PST-78 TaxID=1165861 RepID=A0A0L0VA06_9BASI|nr:hypothetical protein Pst134EB_029986 [Puccinia striiformis f. sp. tritici]KNE96021.1 hypothetical protein PSTG_10712 [Puccinia striiformis f. sp. tritici PST-78]
MNSLGFSGLVESLRSTVSLFFRQDPHGGLKLKEEEKVILLQKLTSCGLKPQYEALRFSSINNIWVIKFPLKSTTSNEEDQLVVKLELDIDKDGSVLAVDESSRFYINVLADIYAF